MKTNRKLLISSVILTALILIGTTTAFGAAGSEPSYWGDSPTARGDDWSGVITLVGLTQYSGPLHPDSTDGSNILYPIDPIVSGIFTANLENRKMGNVACSAQAYAWEDPEAQSGPKYYYFHAIGDGPYSTNVEGGTLFRDALQNFIQDEIKKALDLKYGMDVAVILKEVSDEEFNGDQLRGDNLENFSSPLFISLKVTIVVQ